MSSPEQSLSNLESDFLKRMERIEGHPICGECLSGNHDHLLTKEAIEQKQSDCKNVD